MVYLGIIIAIFTGDLFIKNYMEKTLVEGKENKRLNGFCVSGNTIIRGHS